MSKGGGTKVGAAELAEALSLTPRRIQQLAAEGMPKASRGKYDVAACVKWYIEYREQRAREDAKPTSIDDAKLRLAVAQAETAELDLAERRGELVSVATYEDRLGRILTLLRSRLLALPGRVAVLLPIPAPEALAIIEPAVAEFMTELSQSSPLVDDE